MKGLQDTVFTWVTDFVETELGKLYAKENNIEDVEACIEGKLGIAYIEDYLNLNLVVAIGNQRDLFETLISIYKYAKIDRNEIIFRITSLKNMIRNAQWIDDYTSEMEYVDEVQYHKDVLEQQDQAFLTRAINLNKNIEEFIALKGIEIETSPIRSGEHFGLTRAE